MKTQLAPLFGSLLAVSLVTGCASGGAPARSQTGDTSTHAACAADKATAGRYASVKGIGESIRPRSLKGAPARCNPVLEAAWNHAYPSYVNLK